MIQEYVTLLAQVLNLVPEDDSDLISILCDICNSYENTASKDELYTYTTFEISQRFNNIEPTELNFVYDDTSKWEKLLSHQSSELSYIIALHIVLCLIENSIVNKQSFAKHPAMKSFVKARLRGNEMDPLLNATFGELYCHVFAIQANAEDIRFVYENTYPYDWNIVENIASQITDQSMQTHLLFENCYLTFANLKIPNSFTLQVTLELLNTTSNRVITLGKNTYLEIRDTHICISNDEFITALFDGFEFEIGVIYSMILCFDAGSVTLFVDHVFIQTIPLVSDSIEDLSTVELGSMLSFFAVFKFTILDYCITPNQMASKSTICAFGYHKGVILDIDIDEIIMESDKNMKVFTLTDISDSFPTGKCSYYQTSDIVGLLLNMNVMETFLHRLIVEKDSSSIRIMTSHIIKYLKNSAMDNHFQSIQGNLVLNYILTLKAEIGNIIDIKVVEDLTELFTLMNTNTIIEENFIAESPLKILLNFRLIPLVDVAVFEQLFIGLSSIFNKHSSRNVNSISEGITILQRTILFQLHSSFDTNDLNVIISDCAKSLKNLLDILLYCNIRNDGTIVHLQFSYFCLKKGHITLAKVLLESLDSVFTQYQIDDRDFLCKSIPINLYVKVIFILMQSSIQHLEILKVAYSILLKLFDKQPGFFAQFTNSNGYKILLSILSTHSISEAELLTTILNVSASKGTVKRDLFYKNILSPPDDGISLFSHSVVINLLDSFIKRNPFAIQEFLLTFIEYLKKMHQRNPNHILFTSPYPIIQSIFGLQMNLEMLAVEKLLPTVNVCNKSLLADIIVQKMKTYDPESFKTLLSYIVSYSENSKRPKSSQICQKMGLVFLIVPRILKRLSALSFTVEKDHSKLVFVENILHLVSISSASWKVHDASWEALINTNLVILKARELISKSDFESSFQTDILRNLNSVQEEIYNWIVANGIRKDSNIEHDMIEQLLHAMLYYQEVLFIERHKETTLSNEVLANILTFIRRVILMSEPHVQFLGLNVFRTICTLRDASLPSISKTCTNESSKCFEFLAKSVKSDDDTLLQALRDATNNVLFSKSVKRLQTLYKMDGIRMDGHRRVSRSQLTHILFKERTDEYDRSIIDSNSIYALFKKDNVNLTKKMVLIEERRLNDYLADDRYQKEAGYACALRVIRKVASTAYLRDFKSTREWYLAARENVKRQRIQLLPVFEPIDFLPSLKLKLQDIHKHRAALPHSDTASTIISTQDLNVDVESEGSDQFALDKNRAVLQLLRKDERILNIWNASHIIGLLAKPGVLVLTTSSLYFISGCYYDSNEKKVLDLDALPEILRDLTIDSLSADLITKSIEADAEIESLRYGWKVKTLNRTIKRPFLLRDTAMELFFGLKNTIMFSFKDQSIRDDVFSTLKKYAKDDKHDSIWSSILEEVNFKSNVLSSKNGISRTSISDKVSAAFTSITKYHASEKILDLWQAGSLSNFDYLMALNTLAGRTFNDLTQYPVFPWVIADYVSDSIDLENPKTYRDLSKPMGAQSEKRMMNFIERFQALKDLDDTSTPPFHYGTHYSSAMIVSSYLVRLQPFADTYKTLQGDQWGPPDRLFNSVSRAWTSASSEASTDVRELIPEFYYLPDFLTNKNSYNFGTTQNGKEVTDVALPPWAKNDPKIFIEINRQALESRYVSEHLNEWIDLVFGFKQRGKEAIKAVNVFNSLSYSGNVDINGIDNDIERKAITGIIHNFGQTPLQIFQHPHPPRKCKAYLEVEDEDVRKFGDLKPSINRTADKQSCICLPSISHRDIKLKNGGVKHAHSSKITVLSNFDQSLIATGDSIGLIKLWRTSKDGLTFLRCFCGHESSIKSIRASLQYDTIISLDTHGTTIVWDLKNGTVINKFSIMAKLVAISPTTGSVSIAGEKGISIFDLNGSIYCLHETAEEISAIAFMDRDVFWPYKYHEKLDTVLVATGNKITVYDFKLVQQKWKLLPQQSISNHQVKSIVDIKVEINNNGSEAGKLKKGTSLITVDKDGRNWSWE